MKKWRLRGMGLRLIGLEGYGVVDGYLEMGLGTKVSSYYIAVRYPVPPERN